MGDAAGTYQTNGTRTKLLRCARCRRELPVWRYPTILGDSSHPNEAAQPCKDCRAAKVAAGLAAQTLEICRAARLGSAVMLLTDLLDVLADPDEISQAGRNPLTSPEGPVGGG